MKKLIFVLCAAIALLTDAIHSAQKPLSEALQDCTSHDKEWKRYQRNVLARQARIPGWCSKEKAKRMMDLIYEVKPDVCVEVGVFGGSSIYPTASALKYIKKGLIYAIDPWSAPDCLEGYALDDPNYKWWNSIDLEMIYQDFLQMLDSFRLSSHCVVMRTTGEIALQQFSNESIDILHIDGNHTEEVALSDAKMYLPKVKKGGYIWFDDVNWSTTRRAWEFLSLHCKKDEERSSDDYFLFKKI